MGAKVEERRCGLVLIVRVCCVRSVVDSAGTVRPLSAQTALSSSE